MALGPANMKARYEPTASMSGPRKSKKPKLLERIDRVDMFSKLYEDSRREFPENNAPTALENLFQELLLAIPNEDLNKCKTLLLFEEALNNTTGYKDLTKTYI